MIVGGPDREGRGGEGGREGEGGEGKGREGGREGGRERERRGGKEGGREGREGGREGRERGREGRKNIRYVARGLVVTIQYLMLTWKEWSLSRKKPPDQLQPAFYLLCTRYSPLVYCRSTFDTAEFVANTPLLL